MPKPLTAFSVVIPARNEESYIEATLLAVINQDYEGPVEIIVVDNASIDKTAAIAKRHAEVVTEKKVGLPRARERGRLAASGEIIVYVDADTLLPPHYLSTLVEVFEDEPSVIATSNPFNFYDGTAGHRAVGKLFFEVVFPLQNLLLTLMGKSPQLLGGNFAVRSKSLEEVGGFDKSILFDGEDLAISKQLSKVGRIKILPNLVSQTSARRFQAHGTLKTCGFYVKNFFAMLLLNKEPDGSFAKGVLKICFLTILVILTFKYIPIWRFINKDRDLTLEYLLLFLLGTFLYGLLYPRSILFGPVVSQLNATEPIVALTFDDGPNKTTTPQVLRILKEENVHATFFLIGAQIVKNPEIAKQIHAEGHGLANHSFDHKWSFPFRRTKTIRKQVYDTQKKIDAVTKNPMKLFRPPHGWRTPWMMKELTLSGYKVVTWDVSLDYIPRITTKRIVRHFIGKTEAGSILLLHDSIWEKPKDKRENLIEALPAIIKEFKERGYRFVRVDEML